MRTEGQQRSLMSAVGGRRVEAWDSGIIAGAGAILWKRYQNDMKWSRSLEQLTVFRQLVSSGSDMPNEFSMLSTLKGIELMINSPSPKDIKTALSSVKSQYVH